MKKLAFFCFLLFTHTAFSQSDSTNCGCQECPLFMPDNAVFDIEIMIAGALNNDLAHADQGLCGVRLNFDHEYLGDLDISLTSPGGQTVTLVGPTGLYGGTDFSTWDIGFVPCDSVANPDPGFSPDWNSSQSWGMFGAFSGTYFPAVGCLESFYVGPVNGVWHLLVVDGQAVDVGNLISAQLFFCDRTGIICDPCGSFPETAFSADTLPDGWTVALADTSTGVAQYIIDFGDGETFVGFPAPVEHIYPDTGAYTIQWVINNGCNRDTALQEVYIQGDLPSADFIVSSTCAGIPPVFNILSEDHVQSWHWILPGATPSESFDRFPAVVYAVAGTYDVWLEVTNSVGVDTIKKPLAVTVSPLLPLQPQVNWVQIGNQIQLTNQSTGADSFIWYLPDGSTSMDTTVFLEVVPNVEYLVNLYLENACGRDTFQQVVQVAAIPPLAFFGVGFDEGCLPFSVSYFDYSLEAPTAWQWYFQGGDPATSNAQNPIVSYDQPGPFQTKLVVSNSAGADSTILTVNPPLLLPVIASFSAVVSGDSIICTNLSQNADNYVWALDGLIIDGAGIDHTFVVDSSGIYAITLVASNACGLGSFSQTFQIEMSGIQPLSSEAFQIALHPNPNSGQCWLDIWLNEPVPELWLAVYDANGRKISLESLQLEQGNNSVPIDLTDVPPGIYALQLWSIYGEKTLRLTVQR